MIVRGLFQSWKVPCWFSYATTMDPQVYLEIIRTLEGLGLHVVTSSCDQGGANQGLASAMGIDVGRTTFANPARPESRIHWIFDVPHILKNLRSALLDKGFIMGTNSAVKTEFGINEFEQLMSKVLCSDVTIAPRLSRGHIYVRAQDRQRVRVAAQLLSESTALALRHVFPENGHMNGLANFILLIGNNLVESFTSFHENHYNCLIQNYVAYQSKQDCVPFKPLADFKLLLSVNFFVKKSLN